MKRIIAFLMISILAVSIFAGCGIDDPLNSKSSSTTSETASGENATEAQKEITKDDYKKDFDGLVKYFADLGIINTEEKNVTEMNAEVIGAENGKRFTNSSAVVELYSYGKKLDKTGKDIIGSVKAKGKYTIYNKDVEAFLSDDDSFLMIYFDSAIGENDKTSDAYKKKQNAVKALKDFTK